MIFKPLSLALIVAGGLAASTITNPSFETPVLGSGNFQYNPTGATWTFTGDSGIAANGSAFNFAPAPNGVQVAFLQVFGSTTSSFSETISSVSVGDMISFSDAARPGFTANSFNVLYNGSVIGSFTPASTTWTTASVTIPVGAPSSGTLEFVSTGATGGDADVGIDNLTSTPASTTPEPGTFALLLIPAVAGLMLARKKAASRG